MSHLAVKHSRFVINELNKLREYKLNFFLSLVRIPIHVGILVLVWTTLFALGKTPTIAGMDVVTFILYIVVARLCAYCNNPWTVYEAISDHIKTGRIALYLTKPVRFPILLFAQTTTQSYLSVVIVIMVLLGANVLRLFDVAYAFPAISYFILFSLSLALAVLLGYMMAYTILLGTFWFDDMWSVWGIWDGIMGLFSGEIIPLTITPWFYTLASVLPFKHLVFTPVFIFLERVTIHNALWGIFQQLLWIGFFTLISWYLLQKGLARMDSQGG